jgi:predicted AAA+ superfamily ATPase
MLERKRLHQRVQRALARSRAVALLGPRQVGKTTLARALVREAAAAGQPAHWLDLEDPTVRAQLAEPLSALRALRGLVAIDEIQRVPELFPVLRVLIDADEAEPGPGRSVTWLLLGSASPARVRGAAESLAGRVEWIDMAGFDLGETGVDALDKLWWRGGHPPSYLAADDADSIAWRRSFARTLIEQDLPQLGIGRGGPALGRFWAMLAHLHGQTWSAADPARSLGVDESTVRRYLDGLTQAFLVRQLQPWFENLGKRQLKAPKVYLRDSGLLHLLLGANRPDALLLHPRCAASWEGFVIDQILRLAEPDEAYYWATHAGAELDLLLFKDGRRVGVEVKRTDAPKVTPSMRHALHDLRLDALYVAYPGSRRWSLADGIEAVPVSALVSSMPGV